MGLYALDDNYGVSTWYDYQGAYDLNTGTDLLLDLPRHIIESDAYVFQGVAFPKGRDLAVPFQGTFSGSLNLIPYSYIIGITGFSINNNQFTVRIYDKGAQTDLYFRQFAWYPTVVSNMQTQANMGEVIQLDQQDKPFGPYLFRDPLIVLPPGVLQVQVTNVQTDLTFGFTMQMLFMVAVPKSTVSLNNRKVVTHADPTGVQTLQSVADILGS